MARCKAKSIEQAFRYRYRCHCHATAHPKCFGKPTQALNADVAGVKLIELVALSTTGENEQVSVSWGDSALLSAVQPNEKKMAPKWSHLIFIFDDDS